MENNDANRPQGSSRPRRPGQRTTGEALLRERLIDAVRRQPLVTVGAACAVGAALGGLIFSRLGRLVFLGVAGYVANELWRSEGRMEIDRLIAKLSSAARTTG